MMALASAKAAAASAGVTALTYAVVCGDVSLFHELLRDPQAAADLNGTLGTVDGLNALHHAAIGTALDTADAVLVVRALLDSGADADARSADVLWRSAGDVGDAGNATVSLAGGRTPLHFAAERSDGGAVVAALLDAGAEPIAFDNDGHTPWELAALAGAREAESLLRAHPVVAQYLTARAAYEAAALRGDVRACAALSQSWARARQRRREARALDRVRRESLAIIAREFDWGDVTEFEPSRVLAPELARAFESYHSAGGDAAAAATHLAPLLGRLGGGGLADVYEFELLSAGYRSQLLDALDRFSAWAARTPHLTPPRRSGSRHGLVLSQVGFAQLLDTLMRNYLEPLARIAYPDVFACAPDAAFVSHYGFVVTYERGKEESIATHADDAELTVNLCLGREGGFTGGRLYFYGLRDASTGEPQGGAPLPPDEPSVQAPPHAFYAHRPGRGIFHRGAQYHGAEPIGDGNRVCLILWCRVAARTQAHLVRAPAPRLQPHCAFADAALGGAHSDEALCALACAWLSQGDDSCGGGCGVNDALEAAHGWTALHLAAIAQAPATLRWLLGAGGADADVYDADGMTPLHYAAGSGAEECVRALLDGKASARLPCTVSRRTRLVQILQAGRTAADEAEENGHAALAAMLRATATEQARRAGATQLQV